MVSSILHRERIGPQTPASVGTALEQLYSLARANPAGLILKGMRVEEDLSIEYHAGDIEGSFSQGPHSVLVLIFEPGTEIAFPLYDAAKDVCVI